MEVAGGSRKDGIDELHRAICHRYVHVLWHRLWMGQHGRVIADRVYRIGCILVSGAVQPLVAFQLQVRAIGMDMADADIWEMACYKMNTAY